MLNSVTWPDDTSPTSRLRGALGGAAGAQSGDRDRDEAVDRGLGRQAAGCAEGVQAVAGQLVRRDIIAHVPGLRGLGQQVLDEAAEVLMRSGDGLTPVQERRELGAVGS